MCKNTIEDIQKEQQIQFDTFVLTMEKVYEGLIEQKVIKGYKASINRNTYTINITIILNNIVEDFKINITGVE